MELNRLAFTAYHRSPWQVFDLTQLFIRSNFLSMLKIYLLFSLPFVLAIFFLIDSVYAIYVMWWLKPIFERPLLDYLSKRSFSQQGSVWESIKSIRQLNFVSILMMMTINRFSLNRAYLSPVEQLEKQQGAAGKKRKMLLLGRCEHKQTFWMIFCIHLESFIAMILALIMLNFIPEGIFQDEQFIYDSLITGQYIDIYFFIYYAAIVLIAPFFVTGGFLMYLNSRIKLEGWDIELTFKRIASKLAMLLSVFFICISSFIATDNIYADENDKQQKTEVIITADKVELEKTRKEIEKIYQDNEFIVKNTTWKPKVQKTKDSDSILVKAFIAIFEFLEFLAPYIGYIIWGLLVIVIMFIAKWLYEHRDRWNSTLSSDKSNRKNTLELPDVFADIPKEQWPEDLLTAAEQASRENKYRQALMYILKFSFVYADQNAPLLLNKSMTENECEKALLEVLPIELHQPYKKLFWLWIQQAWAHKMSTAEDVNALITSFRLLEDRETS